MKQLPASVSALPEPLKDYLRKVKLDPLDAGPLSLAAIYFQATNELPLPRSAPLVSPDACFIAYSFNDVALRVSRLDVASAWTSFNNDLGIFAHFGVFDDSVHSFAWASDSRFLWTAIREKPSPSGDAFGMRPAHAGVDGKLDLLPPLSHASGSLDALLWAGSEGLAVAKFGTLASQSAANPTFAIVDALRGSILDTVAFDAIVPPPSQSRFLGPRAGVKQARATVLPDGRVRLLCRVLRQWVVWTQGRPPAVLPDPYASDLPPPSHLALSADGTCVLVGRHLRSDGAEHIRGQGTIPGRAVEGVLLALHDIGTGRELWTIRATAVHDFQFPAPVLSPDGRMALVGLMPTEGIPPIGLVSTQDGKVLQKLPAPGGRYAIGFARGGQIVWTHANGLTAFYELRGSSQ
jgi:hypothetical protein